MVLALGGVVAARNLADLVAAGRCRIIAPEHFLRETVAENVIAGYAMSRRAQYQFGPLLPAGPRQHVDCGLGKAIPFWPPGLIAPTEEITEDAGWNSIEAVEEERAVVVDGEISDAFSLGTPAAKEYALEELTPMIEEALDDQ